MASRVDGTDRVDVDFRTGPATESIGSTSMPRLYVVEWGAELWHINPDDPDDTSGDYGSLGNLPTDAASITGATFIGDNLYVVDSGDDQLWRINPSDPDDETGNYGLVGSLPAGLTSPQGLTFLGTDLLAVDRGTDSLWRINPNNPSDTSGVYGEVGDFPSGLTSVRAVANLNGEIYALDDDGDELWHINPDDPDDTSGDYGEVGDFPSGLTRPFAMVALGTDLLVADNDGDELFRINPADPDSTAGDYGEVGSFPSGLGTPTGMAMRTTTVGDPVTATIGTKTAGNPTNSVEATPITPDAPVVEQPFGIYVNDALGDEIWLINHLDPDSTDGDFGRLGRVPFDIGTTGGMAFLDGDLLVTDDTTLYRVNPSNVSDSSGVYGEVGDLPSGLFSNPRGITVFNGDLWVVDNDGDQLYRVNPSNVSDTSGNYGLVGSLPSGLTSPHGITEMGGDLWVVDSTDNDLWRINPDDPDDETGNYGLVGSLPSGLTGPSGITEMGGDLWVVDSFDDDLWRINPDDPDDETGNYGLVGDLPSGLFSPQGITVLNSDLWVADNSGFTKSLWRINPADPDDTSGVYGEVGDLPSDIDSLQGLTEMGGDLWVVDNDGELWRINPDDPDDISGNYGVAAPSFERASGAVDYNGDLLILSFDRLWRINPADPDDTSGNYGHIGLMPSGFSGVGMAFLDRELYVIGSTGSGNELWRINPDDPDDTSGNYGRIGDLPSDILFDIGLTSVYGDLFVATTESGLQGAAQLWRINPSNPSVTSGVYGNVGDFPSGLSNPNGMVAPVTSVTANIGTKSAGDPTNSVTPELVFDRQPITANIGSKSAGDPTNSFMADPRSQVVAVDITKSAGNPANSVEAEVRDIEPVGISITKGAGNPTSTLSVSVIDRLRVVQITKSAGNPTNSFEATIGFGTPHTANIGTKSAGNPTNSVEAEVRTTEPVTATIASSAGSPTNSFEAIPRDQVVTASIGTKSTGSPTNSFEAEVRDIEAAEVRITKSAGDPTASFTTGSPGEYFPVNVNITFKDAGDPTNSFDLSIIDAPVTPIDATIASSAGPPTNSFSAFVSQHVVEAFGPSFFLCEITLSTGEVLRYSDQNRTVADAFWDGRIRGISSIKSSIGSIKSPRFLAPKISLKFFESDLLPEEEQFSFLFERHAGFANATVRFLFGSGEDLTTYLVLFSGRVQTPGGKTWEEDAVKIDFVSDADRRNRLVPAMFFNADDHSAYDNDVYGDSIPRAFGDFTAAPQQYLPTIKVANNRFFIVHPDDITSIDSVQDQDGNALAYTDNNDGSITITSTIAASDRVFASIEATSTFDGSDKMDGLAKWIIVELLGDQLADLDTASWDAFGSQLGAEVKGRFYLHRQQKAANLLIQALDEVFYDLVITEADQYRVVSRAPDALDDLRTIGRNDLAVRAGARRSIKVRFDPEHLLANSVRINYALDPASGDHTLFLTQEDSLSQERLGFTEPRVRDGRFLYTEEGAQWTTERMLKLFGREIRKVEGKLQENLDLLPGDQIFLEYGPFPAGGVPVQIRESNRDPIKQATSIIGWVVEPLSVRGWTGDASAAYASASARERLTAGYWTDDNGQINGITIDSKWGAI